MSPTDRFLSMDIHEASEAARDLMDEWIPPHWRLVFLRSRRKIGNCNFRDQTLGLSQPFVELNEWPVVEQVILHEIAHALAGHKAGHGPEWVDWALRVGVTNPSSRYSEGVSVPGRYRAECPGCGGVTYAHRQLKSRKSCRACSGGRFNEQFVLNFVDTSLTSPTPSVSVRPKPRKEPIMSDSISAPQLAAQIGTDPKTLRRFLRENDSFRNPGSGNRYSFTASEAASAERAFKSWLSGRRPRSSQTTGETRPKSKNAERSRARQSEARKRVDALETSLLASGKHISQHS